MFVGTHIIADMYEIANEHLLKDEHRVTDILIKAAEHANSTVLDVHSHKFSGGEGVSVVVIIAESHISIHTYPEYNLAMADIFTCGTEALPKEALQVLLAAFQPKRVTIHQHSRGKVDTDVYY